MCDWNRIAATVGIAFWPMSLSAPKAEFETLMKISLGVWLALTLKAGLRAGSNGALDVILAILQQLLERSGSRYGGSSWPRWA
jgi:hypothetical protein